MKSASLGSNDFWTIEFLHIIDRAIATARSTLAAGGFSVGTQSSSGKAGPGGSVFFSIKVSLWNTLTEVS
ncbi:MAG TPA: hypothetical protein VJR30_08540 [Bradyrhizobium sp.]|nr:hypothetical protein [Bradyrhizobium sp.]